MPAPRILELPGHLRYYHEDVFLDELRTFGMTKRRFRQWLRLLQVPFLELGKHRYVEHLAFSIALRSVTRIGLPDHTTPGSDSRTRRPLPPPPSLSEPHLRLIIAEMLAAARLANPRIPKSQITEAARKAAAVLLQSGYTSLSVEAQNAAAPDHLEAAFKLNVLDNDPPLPPSTPTDPREPGPS
jgi:hypothetical protein